MHFYIPPLGSPSSPEDPAYTVLHYGRHNVTITVEWTYPEDGSVVDNYTITATNLMSTTSSSQTSNKTEAMLTLPYNEEYTVEIVATNCAGRGDIVTFSYFEGKICHTLYCTIVRYDIYQTFLRMIHGYAANATVWLFGCFLKLN